MNKSMSGQNIGRNENNTSKTSEYGQRGYIFINIIPKCIPYSIMCS